MAPHCRNCLIFSFIAIPEFPGERSYSSSFVFYVPLYIPLQCSVRNSGYETLPYFRPSAILASQSWSKKAQKNGFLSPSQASLADMCQRADAALFSDILGNRNHVLHGLLPPVQSTGYQLRPRAHDRVRPQDANPLLRQNFIYRNLANDYFYLV